MGKQSDEENQEQQYHEDIDIEEFEYNKDSETYCHPCPCGDDFEITKVFVVYVLAYDTPAHTSFLSLHL